MEAEQTPFIITNRDILCPERMSHRKADKIAMTDFTVKKDNLANLVSCFFHTETVLALILEESSDNARSGSSGKGKDMAEIVNSRATSTQTTFHIQVSYYLKAIGSGPEQA